MNEMNEMNEINEWMGEWINEMNEWMNERTNERMNECKETQWMNECKNEWMLVWQGPASFGDHGSHFTPKTQGFAPDSVFKPELTRSQSLTRPNYLMMMWLPWCGGHDDVVGQWQSSSRYSLVHIYRPHLPKGLRDPQVFLKSFSSRNRALATVSCTVCQPHLPKELRDLQFFNIFKWKSSSRYSLVHSLPTSSSKRAPGPSVF